MGDTGRMVFHFAFQKKHIFQDRATFKLTLSPQGQAVNYKY